VTVQVGLLMLVNWYWYLLCQW